MKKKDIDKSDIGEYYWRYIDLVEEEDLFTALEKCGERFWEVRFGKYCKLYEKVGTPN